MSLRCWVLLVGLSCVCLSVSGRTQLTGAEGYSYCECYFEVFDASAPGKCEANPTQGEVDTDCLLSFSDKAMYMGDMGPHRSDGTHGSELACRQTQFGGAAEIYSGKQPPYKTCDQLHLWDMSSCSDAGGDYWMKLAGEQPVCMATKKEDGSEISIMTIPNVKKDLDRLTQQSTCNSTNQTNTNVRLVCFPSSEEPKEPELKEEDPLADLDVKLPTKEEAMKAAGADAMCEGPCHPPGDCELIQEDDSTITLEELIEDLGFKEFWEYWKDPGDTPPKLPEGLITNVIDQAMKEAQEGGNSGSVSSPTSHPAAPEAFVGVKSSSTPGLGDIANKVIEMFTKFAKAQDTMFPIYSDKCKGSDMPYAKTDSCDSWRTCKDEKDPFNLKDAYDEKEAMEMSNKLYLYVKGKAIPKKIKGIKPDTCTVRCGPEGIFGLPKMVFFGIILVVLFGIAAAVAAVMMMKNKKKKRAVEEEEEDWEDEEEDWGDGAGKTGDYNDFTYSEAQ